MKWLKWFATSDNHPQIQASGFWGARTFEVLCRISRDFDLDGVVPLTYANPAYLARRLMADETLETVSIVPLFQSALAKCEAAGLLRLNADGSVEIDGWERHNGSVSTPRVQKYRERLKRETVTPVSETHETVSSVSETRGEERRGENKREEEASSPSAPAPRKRARKERAWTLAASAAQVAIREATGVAYPLSSFDGLVAQDIPEADALAVVAYAATDEFWSGKVRLDPTALFRAKTWPSLLAKSQAPKQTQPAQQGAAYRTWVDE